MRQRLLVKKGFGGAPLESTATIRRLDQQASLDDQEQAVYVGWLNWKLVQLPNSVERRHIGILFDDLADGVALCQLAEVLTKKALRFNKAPGVAPMMMDNCSVALNSLKEIGATGVEARNFVNKDLKDNNRLVLGFLWQLVQLEIDTENSGDVYLWVAEYLKGYPAVPKHMDASHFRDGRMFSFLLHKSVPNAVDLSAMELQSPHDRLVNAIREAKRSLGVPALISAESAADPNTKDRLLLTYLIAFRSCLGLEKSSSSSASATASASNIAPVAESAKEGKFATLRSAGPVKSGIETLRVGPEHEGQSCPVCEEPLDRMGLLVKVMPEKIVYHSSCFVCRTCKKEFDSFYWPYQLIPYCLTHFIASSNMICVACNAAIMENAVIVHGNKFHSSCFVCSKNGCHGEFAESYNLHGGKPFCDEHYKEVAGVTCSGCGLAIDDQAVKALGGLFHKNCFACFRCSATILREGEPPLQFFAMDGKAICLNCHEATIDVAPNVCGGCKKAIAGIQCVSALGSKWCTTCFVCVGCKKQISNGGFYNIGGNPYDEECARKL